MEDQTAPIDKIAKWVKQSVILKLLTITILTLLLLIPSSMIQSLIREREALNEQALMEVSSKWAGNQEINGPVLTIPLVYEKEKEGETETYTQYFHILPDALDIESSIEPEKLRRGIYEVVVYRSAIQIDGKFTIPQGVNDLALKEVKYDQAFLTVGISDLRGIEDQVNLNWNGQSLSVQPGSRVKQLIPTGITVVLPDLGQEAGNTLDFDFALKLQGSRNMSFIPLGNTTNVAVSSSWNSPSFNGNFLPDFRDVTEEGFTARWKILQLNRNFPQSWFGTDPTPQFSQTAFGFDLLLPVDDYKKSIRSVKYGIMTIALTFLIFFLVEMLNRRKIHPFQYTLVGLALCLFYILLISISEHSNFNLAYGISTVCIVTMITLYSATILKMRKLTILLNVILSGIYGFIFITLQLSDYALLMGSVGLVLILAATMYFTRNINWYNLTFETD